MSLTDTDRKLLERCIAREPGGWEAFVDRFLGLFLHVIQHAAHSRSAVLTTEDRDDLCADIMLTLVNRNFSVLRRFRGNASLASYLAVVARRVAIRQLVKARQEDHAIRQHALESQASPNASPAEPKTTAGAEQLAHLLSHLDPEEAKLVTARHIEGQTYQQLSEQTGLSENAVGPALSRIREKLRKQGPAEA